VAVHGGCLPVDGPPQVEVPNDGTRAQVEILFDQLADLGVGNPTGTKGFDVDAQRLGHTNGVGQLDFTALGQACHHDVLGHRAGRVGGAAVDFGAVLARKSALRGGPSPVGVDDNFRPVSPGVPHRPGPRQNDRSDWCR
jgi:hypothetical protein